MHLQWRFLLLRNNKLLLSELLTFSYWGLIVHRLGASRSKDWGRVVWGQLSGAGRGGGGGGELSEVNLILKVLIPASGFSPLQAEVSLGESCQEAIFLT